MLELTVLLLYITFIYDLLIGNICDVLQWPWASWVFRTCWLTRGLVCLEDGKRYWRNVTGFSESVWHVVWSRDMGLYQKGCENGCSVCVFPGWLCRRGYGKVAILHWSLAVSWKRPSFQVIFFYRLVRQEPGSLQKAITKTFVGVAERELILLKELAFVCT